MVDAVRQEVFALADTVVVKVGTNVITTEVGQLDLERVQSLSGQVQRLRHGGRRIVLVSSGAIGAGMGRLGLHKRPADLPHLQAAAAVGQSYLMAAYEDAFRRHGTHVGQILLTASDFDNRKRYLNARNTIVTLFEWNCVPVLNENDTVSVAEIKFGDNDHLAAMVANLLQAPLLVLLTNVDGLFACDPRTNRNARMLTTVPVVDDTITGLAEETRSALGTGGMRSKLKAARLVTSAGGAVIMANGAMPNVLDTLAAYEPVGTLFLPHGGNLKARQRWIGLTAQPRGRFVVDAGARHAIVAQRKSLLAAGVIDVVGEFRKGDVVAVSDATLRDFGRGLTNYSSAEARRIKGLRSEEIIDLLGPRTYAEIIHRDNLVITS